SGSSNEVLVFVAGLGPCTAPPQAPSALRFAVTGSSVALAWSPSSGATTYIVSVGSAPGASDLAGADLGNPTPSTFAPDVAPGNYFVRVSARNGCGTSGTSNEVAIVVR